MSNAARKARKRAGVPFVKPAKVGTPSLLRVSVYMRPDGVFRKPKQQQRRARRAGWVHEEKGEEK